MARETARWDDESSRLLQVGAYAAERLDALEALEKRLGGHSGSAQAKRAAEAKSALIWRTDQREGDKVDNGLLQEVEEEPLWQKPLARHMQRRTRSHMARKMPVKLRLAKAADKRLEEGLAKRKGKRARKSVLIEKNQKRWTVSHLWSVKRMQMGLVPGIEEIKIALRSQDRGLRFTLNASKHGCTVFDYSYAIWLEVPWEMAKSWVPSEAAPTEIHEIDLLRVPAKAEADALSEVPCGPARMIPANLEKKTVLLFLCRHMKPSLEKTILWGHPRVVDRSLDLTLFRLRGDRTHEVLGSALGKSVVIDQYTRASWNTLMSTQRSIFAPRCLPDGLIMQVSVENAKVSHIQIGHDPEVERKTSVTDPARAVVDLSQSLKQCRKSIQPSNDSQTTLLTLVRHRNGWDLIIPRRDEIARNLWVLLIHSEGSPVGIEDERAAEVASGRRLFPDDYPGTEAFDRYWAACQALHIEENEKRPKGKRKPSPHFPQEYVWIGEESLHCDIKILSHQPKGCRAWVDVGAELVEVLPDEENDLFKQRKHADQTRERKIIGIVTSALGRARIRPSSRATSYEVSAKGFLDPSMLKSLVVGKQLHALVRNPGTFALTLAVITRA
mmetsp:Transcript_15864/g.30675  ORF Transcript_15864/g.30675 Transcript_15864/m.30675 type:complete len:612 (-) Transcript_15864:42-1877(-)